ncbi:MAG: transposase [Myxococcota bacterium]
MYGPEGIYFVTARTHQGQLLLRPSERAREIIGAILARAARRYGVKLRGYVFLSNHLHLLVRARGVALSGFMQFLLSNIAKKINALLGRVGTFWQRRFSCEPVLDAEAELDRLRYILAHGVKERLVAHPGDWPGLTCLKALLGEDEVFPFYNWDWRHTKRGLEEAGRWSPRIVESERVELEPITAWASCDASTRALLARELADALAAEHAATGRPVLGARAVMREDPHRSIPLKRRGQRPRCHTSSALVRVQWLQLFAEFVAAYRAASARFRAGELDVVFPPWTLSPPGRPMIPDDLRRAGRVAPRGAGQEVVAKRVPQHVFPRTNR